MNQRLTVSRLDGIIDYYPGFLTQTEQAELFGRLRAGLAWHQESLRIGGQERAVPREVAWYGDPEARYRYSGVTHEPLPWTAELASLRQRLQEMTGAGFNSVLANLYRDGNDSMGWHSDAEPELGHEPVIASLSLGSKRRFLLEHRRSGTRLALALGEGGLLLMAGATQHHWRHALPKTRQPVGPRINLTFRFIHPPGDPR